jgi:nucleoside-diphosphate-sugar epimerase
MKFLILGGTAFTGPYIVRTLSELGHEVRLYHRGHHLLDPLPPNVKKVNADLSSLKLYRDFLRQQSYDAVLHMIAMTRHDARAAVEAFSGHAGRIVVASSQDVYAAFGAFHGKQESPATAHPMREDAPLRSARYLYGGDYEKLDVEEVFQQSSNQLPATIIRMPATFGPGDPRRRFFPYLKRMEDKRPAILLEPAMANFRWSHGYVENVARAFVLALTTPHAPPAAGSPAPATRIYNVSETPFHSDAGITNGAPTVAERLHWLARAAGYKGRIVVVPRDRAPAHLIKPYRFEHDIVTSDALIRRELGYADAAGPEEALRRTVAWERANPVPEPEIDPAEFDYAAEDRLLGELGI